MGCLEGGCNQSTAKICSARFLSTRGSLILRSEESRTGSVLSKYTGVTIEIFQFYHFHSGGSLKPRKKTKAVQQQPIANSNCCDAVVARRSARKASELEPESGWPSFLCQYTAPLAVIGQSCSTRLPRMATYQS